MTTRQPVEYRDVESVDGPLLVVRGVEGVGWDEYALIHTADGPPRHGTVLEVNRDLAIVQTFEGTVGLGPEQTSVAFTGSALTIPVGTGWLGRICDGRGNPIDGGPPILADEWSAVTGYPINPVHRESPRDPVTTGVSAIDGLATLVRGQKLPLFSQGGLPHLDLALQIASQSHAGEDPFRVVFAAMGVTRAEVLRIEEALQGRLEAEELALLINTADDPAIERILTPRLALTVAEHLAFRGDQHVLVLMYDMTNYCEAVREVAASHREVPTRRGYPGYLYSDLASLYERCGRIQGRPGSLTLMPVLTMPAGDITHPVPDLTGYITEGQVVLSTELQGESIYPPVEPLESLSRLMRHGAGAARTREDHLEVAAQLQSLLADAREAAQLADLLGEDAISDRDRRSLAVAEAFRSGLLSQDRGEARTFDETLDRAWQALSLVPRAELTLVSERALDAHYVDGEATRSAADTSDEGGAA
jgi:V/A-type H+-transporting ATPase subunit B